MPASIHRTTAWYSFRQLASSSELPPYQSQSSMDLHHGCWKAPFDIQSSTLDDPISTEYLDNQSDPMDPPIPMVYSAPWMHPMFKLWQSLTACSPYSMTSPCRSFQSDEDSHQVCMQYIGLDSSLHQGLLKIMHTCSHATSCHKPYGLLKQLPIPKKPWFHSMDFIRTPPSLLYLDSSQLFDHSQSSHSSSHSRYITSPQLAQLFFYMSFTKHGVPTHHFWLWYGIHIHFFGPSDCEDMKLPLHFRISSWRWWTPNEPIRLWNSTSKFYCNYQQDIGQILPLLSHL